MADVEHISRDRAKELIDESDYGILILSRVEKIPTIGTVEPEERKLRVDTIHAEFGDEHLSEEEGALK